LRKLFSYHVVLKRNDHKNFSNREFRTKIYRRVFSDYITGTKILVKILFTMWLGKKVMKEFFLVMTKIGKR
jgi:hypothetical protein